MMICGWGVTAGIVEGNGSLPPDLWQSNLHVDWLETRIISSPNVISDMRVLSALSLSIKWASGLGDWLTQ